MGGKIQWRRLLRPGIRTLKTKLVIYLLIGSLLPLILLAVITYFTTYSIMVNKIESGIQSALKQESIGLENTLYNLAFASKQFAVDGQVVEEVFDYLQTKDTFRKSELMDDINKKMNIVNYTNPNLGLTFYYLPGSDNPVLFENLIVSPRFHPEDMRPISTFQGATFFGPHKTFYAKGENLVFSALRNVTTGNGQKLYIYLETNFSLFQKIISDQPYGFEVSHYLTDRNGQIVYTDYEGGPEAAELTSQTDKFHFFTYKSEQGWSLNVAVQKSVINSEINEWFYRIIFLVIGTFIFACLLAYLIWRSIYGLLRKMNKEIQNMAHNVTSPVQYTNVEEFDVLLKNFHSMKRQIADLISTVETDEKKKSELEIEKLLSQINPHFLHNTLNTVQWLARMNGQKEIHRLVTLLVKVLQYNLGKQSIIVTVQDEVEAIRNYIELQRIRYDYEFDIVLDIDPLVLHAAIPRFMLQPLLENALYHGGGDQESGIVVRIYANHDPSMTIQVTDHGQGMDAEQIQLLLEEEHHSDKRGLGIGFPYVNRLLKRYFVDQADIKITSSIGKGTEVTIVVPMFSREEFHDQSHGGR